MRFFKELYKTDGYLEIRTLPTEGSTGWKDLPYRWRSWGLETNVFYGVGLRSRKEGTADAAPPRTVDRHGRRLRRRGCQEIMGFQVACSVRTGGGFHAYRRSRLPARTTQEKQIRSMHEGTGRGGRRPCSNGCRASSVSQTRKETTSTCRHGGGKFELGTDRDFAWLPQLWTGQSIPEEIEGDERAHAAPCDAATLSEPEWYAWISNICGFHKSPRYIHEVSRRYPKHRASETDSRSSMPWMIRPSYHVWE